MRLTEQELPDLVNVNGNWVEKDVLRIVEAIQAYDPDLRVQYFEGLPGLDEAPYRIVRTGQDGTRHVVMTCWNLDDTVLARLYFSDTRIHDVDKRIRENNEKVRQDGRKKRAEENLEIATRSAAVVASPRDTYTVPDPFSGDLLTIKSNGTVTRKEK